MAGTAGTTAQRKAEELEQLLAELESADRALTQVHLLEPGPVEAGGVEDGGRALADVPGPVDLEAITARKRREALAGITGFRPFARRNALKRADAEAIDEAALLNRANYRRLRESRSRTDTHPKTAATRACAASGLDFRCVSADGGRVTLVGTFASPEIVPDRVRSRTPAGRTTTRKRTKTERNAVYVEALGSTVLAVAKTTFTSVPAATTVRVVVLTDDSLPDVLFTGSFPRSFLSGIDWNSIEPGEEILFADEVRLQRKGVAQDVVPVEIDDTELAALIAEFRN